MTALTWGHHTIIQALMYRGPLKNEEIGAVFTAVSGKQPGGHEFSDYLLKINKELLFFQLELRCCRDQNDGEIYYGIVNNVPDDQSKFGTAYSVPQIAFFKGILEAIVDNSTPQGTISTFHALNINLDSQVGAESQSESNSVQVPAALRNFTMSQKEKTIEELVQDKWLCRPSDGDIGLGPRSYLDLRSWFLHSGLPSCSVCNEVGFQAERCQSDGCDVRFHRYCLKEKISQNKGRFICDNCGVLWRTTFSGAQEDENTTREVPNRTSYEQKRGKRKKSS